MHLGRLLLCAATAASAALADGLDRDSLLTEAPATPPSGNLRFAASGNTSYVGQLGGGVSGVAMWTPFTHFAADVSGYWQDGDAGPAVRVRFQLLEQALHGLDLALGARYKSVGLNPRNGEVEGLLALGRRFGPLGAVLNTVAGHELGGPGFDVEVKALVDYQVLEVLRVGLDFRAQAELHDENGWKSPDLDRDVAMVGGVVVSWFPLAPLQLQLLVGATHPRLTTSGPTVGPTARLLASFDLERRGSP